MYTKRSTVVLLVVTNLILVAALLIPILGPPGAQAQSGGRRGDYVCVTANAAGQTYDVLYLLDVRERMLHALYPTPAPRSALVTAPPRNLLKDFERK